jgi:hypothetical protein
LKAISISVVIVEESWRGPLYAGHADLSPDHLCRKRRWYQANEGCLLTTNKGVTAPYVNAAKISSLKKAKGPAS